MSVTQGALTQYAERALLDHILGGGNYSRPANVHFGLCTGVDDAGTVTGEPSGNNYARKEIVNNDTNFPAADTDLQGKTTKKNGTEILFNEASGSWGTISHGFISDHGTPGQGNVLMFVEFADAKPIGAGDVPRIKADSWELELD